MMLSGTKRGGTEDKSTSGRFVTADSDGHDGRISSQSVTVCKRSYACIILYIVMFS